MQKGENGGMIRAIMKEISPFGGRGAIEQQSKRRVTHETDLFGAAKAVTGSCHCVEVRGKKDSH